jgi:uncharacterized protein (DUF58 family)
VSLRPTSRLLALMGGVLLLSLATGAAPMLRPLLQGALALIAVVALLDAMRPGWSRAPELARRLSGHWSVGHHQKIVLSVKTASARPGSIQLIDDAPQIGPVDGLPLSLEMRAGQTTEVSYGLLPNVRGEALFGPAEVLLTSPLGLWAKRRTCGMHESIMVVPDHGPALRMTLQSLAHRISPTGTRRRPRRGQGTSFHQLREYRDGDLPQQIDWKASSKRHQLISREYEEERDQRVLIALDRGRRMCARDGQRTLFDRALDASLVLAYVALRQGDSVGLLGFSGPVDALPPAKGRGALPRLFGHVQAWQPSDAPSDFAEAARNVLTRESRRTLLVLITNLRGEDSNELVRAVRSLQGRHLVVVASVREATTDSQLEQPAKDLQSALSSCSAALVLEERRQALEAVSRAGALTIDTTAKELPTALAEAYLGAKRSGAL